MKKAPSDGAEFSLEIDVVPLAGASQYRNFK
jgi:hypothetical protein